MIVENDSIKSIAGRKVGLVTFYTGNYGSILQCLALQTAIKEFGYDPIVIRHNMKGPFPGSGIIDNIKNRGLADTVRFYKNVLKSRAANVPAAEEAMNTRARKLDDFVLESLTLTKREYGRRDYKEAIHEADLFVVGSDQVWNPKITAWSKFYWLEFVNDGVPKFSYAPSMGVTDLKPSSLDKVRCYLSDYISVSARETSTARMLNSTKAFHGVVHHVCDPTLLLSSNYWTEYIQPISERICTQAPYLFAYILRGNSEQYQRIMHFAKSRGLRVVTYPYLERDSKLNNMDTWGDEGVLDDDPRDFLARIKNADCVITDSFHCTLFSILFHKEFYVLPKACDTSSQSTRVIDLLDLCGMGDRMSERSFLPNGLDFDFSDDAIDSMRRMSLDYLKSALEACEARLARAVN